MKFANIMKICADCENNPIHRHLMLRERVLEQREELINRCINKENKENMPETKNEAH